MTRSPATASMARPRTGRGWRPWRRCSRRPRRTCWTWAPGRASWRCSWALGHRVIGMTSPRGCYGRSSAEAAALPPGVPAPQFRAGDAVDDRCRRARWTWWSAGTSCGPCPRWTRAAAQLAPPAPAWRAAGGHRWLMEALPGTERRAEPGATPEPGANGVGPAPRAGGAGPAARSSGARTHAPAVAGGHRRPGSWTFASRPSRRWTAPSAEVSRSARSAPPPRYVLSARARMPGRMTPPSPSSTRQTTGGTGGGPPAVRQTPCQRSRGEWWVEVVRRRMVPPGDPGADDRAGPRPPHRPRQALVRSRAHQTGALAPSQVRKTSMKCAAER